MHVEPPLHEICPCMHGVSPYTFGTISSIFSVQTVLLFPVGLGRGGQEASNSLLAVAWQFKVRCRSSPQYYTMYASMHSTITKPLLVQLYGVADKKCTCLFFPCSTSSTKFCTVVFIVLLSFCLFSQLVYMVSISLSLLDPASHKFNFLLLYYTIQTWPFCNHTSLAHAQWSPRPHLRVEHASM